MLDDNPMSCPYPVLLHIKVLLVAVDFKLHHDMYSFNMYDEVQQRELHDVGIHTQNLIYVQISTAA